MPEIFLYCPNKAEKTGLNVWCAFPAVYRFGMSALGYLTVFQQIDAINGVCAERIFTDTEKTYINPVNVDIIAFSFSFELDYLGILEILEKYNIPFLSKDRDDDMPLIYAGGPVVSANPEPFADFFDFIMIGDAEPNIKKIFEILRDNKDKSKSERLELLSKIEGVYIPQKKDKNYKVKKAHSHLKECVATPILTEESFFPDTYIIEIERGCPNSCGFCLTSFINTPVRFVPYEAIIDKLETGLKYTDKIALLGAQICSHPQIDNICNYITDKADKGRSLEVTVSSLRADYVSDKMFEMLRKCGQKTATIAIEAGSERLRQVINKHLNKNDIINVVDKMNKYGFKGLKMYGIIGLPTETYEDLDEFVDLCREIKQKYKGFLLTPSFSTFVPKAHTPFQYAKRENINIIEKKNEYIKKQFAKIGIKARTSSAKWDSIQYILSRGSRVLTPFLIAAYNDGGSIGAFKKAYKDIYGLNIFGDNDNIYEENLPWSFIEYPRNSKYLKSEYKRLLALK